MLQNNNEATFLGISHAGKTENLLPHIHDYYEINYTLRGNVKIKVGNQLIACETQDFILIPPKMSHNLYALGEGTSGSYVLRFTAVPEFMSDILREKTIVRFRDYDTSLYFLVSEIYRIYSSGKNHNSSIFDAYLNIVLKYMKQGEIIDVSDAKEEVDLIEKTVNYIHEFFLTRQITVNSLAEMVNISPAHYSRLFQKRTSMSPMRYLTEVKMDYAKKLLQNESLSIKEISQRLQYSDQLYFSRVFKKYNGISPKKFRQNE